MSARRADHGEEGAGPAPRRTEWSHVSQPTPSRPSSAPRHAPTRAARPDRRSRIRVIAVVLATAMVVSMSGVVAFLLNSHQPDPPTAVASAQWPLALPIQVGAYSRDPATTTRPSTHNGITTLSATYAKDDKDAVVVLMSRPATDLDQFMSEAAMNAVTDQALTEGGNAKCGTSLDNNHTSCAVIQDSTAVLVVGLLDQPRSDLAELAHTVAVTAAG